MKIDNQKILSNPKFEKFIISLIIINLIIFALQTDINIQKSIGKFLFGIETFSIIVFSIEYILRILTIKNWREIFSLFMVIDLLAILPFYLSFIPINTIFLRIFRIFRIFRLAKIARYTNAIKNIKMAFSKRKHELIITASIFVVAVFISSTLIYFAEHNVQTQNFQSIPESFWWAIITFTTVGYGDTCPITSLGKLIASLSAIFGIGIHGLVIGIISSALIDIIQASDKTHNS